MDHDGAARALKELSGAEIYLSREDDEWRRRPEADMHDSGFKIADYEADRYYSDEEPIVMGDVTVHTRLSAGHTPGTTSFFVTVKGPDGKPLVWGMHGGVGINTMNTDYLNKVHLPLSPGYVLKGLRRHEIHPRRHLYPQPSLPLRHA